MWRPDFPFVARKSATVVGYHRAFCIKSTHYRGTAERPGLVLGLDRGRSCTGVVFAIAPDQAAAVVDYLRRRELIYGVYRETKVLAEVHEPGATTREVPALTYVAERLHPAYTGGLALADQAAIIRCARGSSGNNLDYAINTVRHLQMLGIREPALERLIALCGPVLARDRLDGLARPSVQALRNLACRMPGRLAPVLRAEQRRFGYRARLTPLS